MAIGVLAGYRPNVREMAAAFYFQGLQSWRPIINPAKSSIVDRDAYS